MGRFLLILVLCTSLPLLSQDAEEERLFSQAIGKNIRKYRKEARNIVASGKGSWRIARTRPMHKALGNKYLESILISNTTYTKDLKNKVKELEKQLSDLKENLEI